MKEIIHWWNLLTFEDQFFETVKWLSSQNRSVSEVHPYDLDNDQIKEIYEFHCSKHNGQIDTTSQPN